MRQGRNPVLQYFLDLLPVRNVDRERVRLGYQPAARSKRSGPGRFRRVWNFIAHGTSEPPYRPDRPRFLSRAWWREEVDTFVCTYALDRIRAPWKLTAAEWWTHAKLFAMNLAAGATFLGVVYLIVAAIFGSFAGFKVAALLGMCWIGAWIVGDYRKERPPWPKAQRDHGVPPRNPGSGMPARIQGRALKPPPRVK